MKQPSLIFKFFICKFFSENDAPGPKIKHEQTLKVIPEFSNSDKDQESAEFKKKRGPVKVATIKLIKSAPTTKKSAKKIAEDKKFNSVDADMPELILPSYCFPEDEFEDSDPLENDD